MPIANCIITLKNQKNFNRSIDLIELWSRESKIDSEHMTINIVSSDEQLGKNYQVMSTLLLPSMWSKSNVSALQIGLAKALSKYYEIPSQEVFVTTSIVELGMVVEDGKELNW